MPMPQDIQVGDVWQCRDGVTSFKITEVEPEPTILIYPIRGYTGKEERVTFTRQGEFYGNEEEDELDLVKLISRNGSPIS
jgi:hypothetical protein